MGSQRLSVQTGPPDTTHLGPARRPPEPHRNDGQAPFRTSLRVAHSTRATGTLNITVVGERGPYLLTFQGMHAKTLPDVTIASLDINLGGQTRGTPPVHRQCPRLLILVDFFFSADSIWDKSQPHSEPHPRKVASDLTTTASETQTEDACRPNGTRRLDRGHPVTFTSHVPRVGCRVHQPVVGQDTGLAGGTWIAGDYPR